MLILNSQCRARECEPANVIRLTLITSLENTEDITLDYPWVSTP